MNFHRAVADVQLTGNVLVALSRGDQLENLLFSRREAFLTDRRRQLAIAHRANERIHQRLGEDGLTACRLTQLV